jgi:hypothetical protein
MTFLRMLSNADRSPTGVALVVDSVDMAQPPIIAPASSVAAMALTRPGGCSLAIRSANGIFMVASTVVAGHNMLRRLIDGRHSRNSTECQNNSWPLAPLVAHFSHWGHGADYCAASSAARTRATTSRGVAASFPTKA